MHPVPTNAAFYGELPGEMSGTGLARASQPQDDSQGASDYLRSQAAKWLVESVRRARKCQRFEDALTAINECLTPHVRESEMDLASLLASFACMEVYQKRGKGKKSLEKFWPVGTGKTWKALREFPERLRRMAKEIEQVNRSSFFAPPFFVNAKTTQAGLVRKRFEQLPGIITLYATGLEMHIARVPKLWAQSLPQSPQGPSLVLLGLSHTVKVCTGKWRDKEVAELLNAAAIALGEKREYDALYIAQARARWKKKKT